MHRFVATHPEYGVYLGSFLGLGFWSKLDRAGQDSAVLFETERQVHSHVAEWESPVAGVQAVPIKTDADFIMLGELSRHGIDV